MNKDLNKYIEDINRVINISMEEIKESQKLSRKELLQKIMVEKATLPSEEMVRYMYKLYQKNARKRGDDSWG